MDTTPKAGFAQWAVVEVMGHKQVAGYVTEEAVFGAAMCRIDIPEVDGHPAQTVYHGGQAIYAVHPCSEALARAAAARLRRSGAEPFPVYVPELVDARNAANEARRLPATVPSLDPKEDWGVDDDDDVPF